MLVLYCLKGVAKKYRLFDSVPDPRWLQCWTGTNIFFNLNTAPDRTHGAIPFQIHANPDPDPVLHFDVTLKVEFLHFCFTLSIFNGKEDKEVFSLLSILLLLDPDPDPEEPNPSRLGSGSRSEFEEQPFGWPTEKSTNYDSIDRDKSKDYGPTLTGRTLGPWSSNKFWH